MPLTWTNLRQREKIFFLRQVSEPIGYPGLGLFNRLPAAADLEFSIDVIQVFFYGFR